MEKRNKRVRVLHVANTDFFLTRLLLGKMKGLIEEGYEVHAAAPESGRSKELASCGIRFFDVPIPRRISLFQDYKAYRALVRVIRTGGYDIVHTHSAKAGFLGRLAAHKAKTPCILHTAHGLPCFEGQPFLKNRIYRFLERFAQKRAHLLLSQNREDMQVMIENRLEKPENIFYEGNGVEIEKIRREASSVGAPELLEALDVKGKEIIGFFARIEPVKGHLFFIKAFHDLLEKKPEALCLMAGANMGGEDFYARRVMCEISERGLNSAVRCMGFREDVIRLITLCDVIVLPSEKEGIPRVLMESMALGKPIVATDVLGTRELITDGETGLLVPYGDVPALSDALNRLLGDRQLSLRLGEAARIKIEQKFDEKYVVKRLETIYRTALKRKTDKTAFACSEGSERCRLY